MILAFHSVFPDTHIYCILIGLPALLASVWLQSTVAQYLPPPHRNSHMSRFIPVIARIFSVDQGHWKGTTNNQMSSEVKCSTQKHLSIWTNYRPVQIVTLDYNVYVFIHSGIILCYHVIVSLRRTQMFIAAWHVPQLLWINNVLLQGIKIYCNHQR